MAKVVHNMIYVIIYVTYNSCISKYYQVWASCGLYPFLYKQHSCKWYQQQNLIEVSLNIVGRNTGYFKIEIILFLCNANWFKAEGQPSSPENLLESLFKRGKLIWKGEIQTLFHTFRWVKQTHKSNSECRSRFNLTLPLLILRLSPTVSNLEINLKKTSIQNIVVYPFSFDM